MGESSIDSKSILKICRNRPTPTINMTRLGLNPILRAEKLGNGDDGEREREKKENKKRERESKPAIKAAAPF